MGNPQSQSGVPHRIAKPGEVFVEALIWPRIRGGASRWEDFFFLSGIPDRKISALNGATRKSAALSPQGPPNQRGVLKRPTKCVRRTCPIVPVNSGLRYSCRA
jgi:hypothetical protein